MADNKRPVGDMESRSKRRAGGNELTRDNFEDNDDGEAGEGVSMDYGNPGSWQPVDPQTRERRKVVRAARRGGGTDHSAPAAEAQGTEAAAAAPAAPASSNPFAGISLATASANPFTGISLLAKTQPPPPATAEASAAVVSPTAAAAEAASTSEGDAGKQDGKDAPAAAPVTPTDITTTTATTTATVVTMPAAALGGGFGALAAGGAKPFGSGFGGGGGFGGFNSLSSSTAAAASAPSVFSVFKPAVPFGGSGEKVTLAYGSAPGSGGALAGAASGGAGEEDDASPKLEPVFGSGPVVKASAPVEPKITGEEGERTVFAVDGAKLFEFDADSKSWRERGQGEFKVNVETQGDGARMLMRSTGNYRLLINAKLFPQLAAQKIGGGVSFCCINTAAAPEVAKASPASEKPPAADASAANGEEPQPTAAAPSSVTSPVAAGSGAAATQFKTTTWAVKVKSAERVEALIAALEKHKGGVKEPVNPSSW